jgi:WD40 repeat protein
MSASVLGVRSVAFVSTGRRFVTGGGDLREQKSPGQVRLWDTTTGEMLLDLTGHNAMVYSVAFSSDETLIATGGGIEDYGRDDHHGELLISNAQTGEALHRIQAHAHAVRAVALSPHDDRLASIGADDRLVLWDVTSGTQLRAWRASSNLMMDVAFGPRGQLLAS